jgi:hypothetical protein
MTPHVAGCRCGLCRHVAAGHPGYMALVGVVAAPTVLPEPIATEFVPCPFEGPIVEYAGCKCEMKHVRYCTAEPSDALRLIGVMEWDGPERCVRGQSCNPQVASCFKCQLHPSNHV